MHSRECILAGMHFLECILKIEDPNTGLFSKRQPLLILIAIENRNIQLRSTSLSFFNAKLHFCHSFWTLNF